MEYGVLLSQGSQYPLSFVPPLPFFHAGASKKTMPLELLVVKIPTKFVSTVDPVKVGNFPYSIS